MTIDADAFFRLSKTIGARSQVYEALRNATLKNKESKAVDYMVASDRGVIAIVLREISKALLTESRYKEETIVVEKKPDDTAAPLAVRAEQSSGAVTS